MILPRRQAGWLATPQQGPAARAAPVCNHLSKRHKSRATDEPKHQAAPRDEANRLSTGACTTEKRRLATLCTRNPQFQTPSLLRPCCRRFGGQSLIRRAVAGNSDNRSGTIPNFRQVSYATVTDLLRSPLQSRLSRWSAISANLRRTGGEIRGAFPMANERCAMEMPREVGLGMAVALSLVVPHSPATEDLTKPVNKSIFSCRIP